MKISAITFTATNRKDKLKNYSAVSVPSHTENTNQLVDYNPVYYRPSISFKGKDFENYFPSEILGISEEQFDNILKETIKNDSKKTLLAEYIIDNASKNNKAMDFINIWRKQIPALISQGTLSIGSNTGHVAINKILNITARNNATSMLQKFNQSDHQTEILMKDGKSAVGGLLSYKLFTLANINPEPYSKAALYLTAFAVGIGSYKMSSEDSKKIQNLQFIDATKALIKLGVLDPYSLINKIDKNILNLSEEKKEAYIQWKTNRLQEIRFEKTGYVKDTHNDFDTEEARNVLKILINTLRENAGFNDEKIAAFLSLMSAQYASVNETREAEYLLNIVAKIQKEIAVKSNKNIFGNDSPALYDTFTTLAYLQFENEEKIKAIDTLEKAATVAETTFGVDSDEYFAVNMKKLEYLQEQRLSMKKMLPYIESDSQISITQNRKEKLEAIKGEIYENAFLSEENKYLLSETKETIRTLLVLIQKNNRHYTDTLKLLDLINKNPDKSLYELLKENRNIPETFIASGNNYVPAEYGQYTADSLTEYSDNEDKYYLINNKKLFRQFQDILPILSSNIAEQKMSLNNNVSRIFTINTLLGKDFKTIDNEIIKQYGECSLERAELYKLQYEKEKMNDEHSRFDYVLNAVPYKDYLLYRFYIIRDNFGMSDDKTMKTLVEYALESKDPYEISTEIIPLLKREASDKIKEKYLPAIYENYAQNWIYNEEVKDQLFISNFALEGIIAYKKAIDTSKKADPKLVYNFLNYLDKLYSNEIIEGSEYFNYEKPLLAEIDRMPLKQSEAERRKYNLYLSWSSFLEDELNRIIKSTSDPFKINERKLLQMKKKYETVIFQSRFNEKMDNRIRAIEKDTNVYEIK